MAKEERSGAGSYGNAGRKKNVTVLAEVSELGHCKPVSQVDGLGGVSGGNVLKLRLNLQ